MPASPPGPVGRIPRLATLAFLRNRIRVIQRLTARYGDVVAFDVAGQPFVILNHPDYVRDVLVTRHRSFHKGIGLQRARLLLGDGLLTSEDAHHQRQRRLLQPAFHRERIAGYGSIMTTYAERAASGWRDGLTVNVLEQMSRLTLAIAGRTLFDAEIESDARTIGGALSAVLRNFNITLLPFGDRLVNWPIPHAVRFRRAKARLDGIVYRLIAERRASAPGVEAGSPAEGRNDLLSILVNARDEADGTGMSDLEIRDEVMTLLLAGHETTAVALTWTWYLLAQHPDARQRLEREVSQVCRDRLPSVDDLHALVWARAVFSEAMRLFPPAYLIGRRAIEPYAVPNTDYQVPAGTVLLLSQYLLHRDPRFWNAPDAFQPARWLTGDPPHRYAYFPFGAGPRICIGEQFAWMEGVLVLATIARHWRFELVAGQKIEVEPIITLRPKGGSWMKVANRKDEIERHAEPST
jgi:cytochrome P450